MYHAHIGTNFYFIVWYTDDPHENERLMILLNSGLKRISADSSRFSLLMKDVDYNDGLDIVLVHTIGSLLTALSCMKAHAINIQFYSGRHTKCVGCIRTPVRKVRKTFFHIILSHLYIKSARSYVIVRQYEVIKSVTGGRRILVLRFFSNHDVLGIGYSLYRHANNLRKSLQWGREFKSNGSC